jgi:hypothetical protein
MGLEINKILDNGSEVNYFLIDNVIFNKNPKTLTIFIAGFKDKAFRDAYYDLIGDRAVLFKDCLNLSGENFTEEIYASCVTEGFPYWYSLLKTKIDYLANAEEA